MKIKASYKTLSKAIQGLKMEGYTLDFVILESNIACHSRNVLHPSEDFEIEILYKVKNASQLTNQYSLYGLSSKKHNLKGILIDRFGISADIYTNASSVEFISAGVKSVTGSLVRWSVRKP